MVQDRGRTGEGIVDCPEKFAVIHMRKGEVADSPIVESIPLLTGEESY